MISNVYEYSGSTKSIQLTPGKYFFELWGAQGGNNDKTKEEKKVEVDMLLVSFTFLKLQHFF